ncbi:amino acid permease [Candidatus Cetobacterium colombiensis]|uniref:Amino acid permease n=1 Tax=Candidatus Cetobacterium colombiensis TaxID=3073100 RepID=A0ABU4WC32_9FUSO|nr:amino acid permease [Candidatus Cetobacterium colombiensis]MDX8336053.1 amino acid permease [Candidatus Cetobacterium colombiensis]
MLEKKEFGLLGLVGVVIGSVIGGGIFNVSKEIAKTSSIGAALIGWLISATGVFFIIKVYQRLLLKRSDLNNGIYEYARVGFGPLAGFFSAWGYWLACVVSNASYPVLIVQTLSYFFPSIVGVKTPQGFILGTILLWLISYIIMKGIKTYNFFNFLATLGKISAIIMSICFMIFFFKYNIFKMDFWGSLTYKGDVFTQIKGCMLQTLWALIGVEGAVVISGRAKNKKDVSLATFIGYFIALFLYILIVILSYGILPAETLSTLNDPALAYILESVIGKWGAIFINISVLISIFGAWITWTIIAAEIPYNISNDNLFPSFLKNLNSSGAAGNALIFNAVIKQIAFILSLFSSNVYLIITNSAAALMLLPYIFSTFFLLKISTLKNELKYIIYGSLALLYCFWMVYAAGKEYMIQTFLIYLAGLPFYFYKKKSPTK